MVCPNCHSNQVVLVQGQHLCVNCGQLVPEIAANAPRSLPTSPLPKKNDRPIASHVLVNAKPTKTAKKRKPGRPKAGRLDSPRDSVAASTGPAIVRRHMSDITTPKPVPPLGIEAPIKTSRNKRTAPALSRRAAPLHYGAVQTFALRSRLRPRLVVLASLPALVLAAAIGYGSWLVMSEGLSKLANQISTHLHWPLAAEILILGGLYYVGRSLTKTALMYGVSREADENPVSLSTQLAVGINSFSRRLLLDSGFVVMELGLVALMAIIVLTGGGNWGTPAILQYLVIFSAFLVLLYIACGLALARGLAGVALTLSTTKPWSAARLGWQLFRHRFELLALRLSALLLEFILVLPLAIVAVALIVATPETFQWLAALGVGVLALTAGALCGAGTATWWVILYRRLVLTDEKPSATQLLSGIDHQNVQSVSLFLVVLIGAILALSGMILSWFV